MTDGRDGVASCWICGAEADSSEHRIKRSDLIRVYGRGPYRGGKAPVHVQLGKVTHLQGPGSRKVVYKRSLCYVCNTTATQPFDTAYEEFVRWLAANEARVLKVRFIDFSDVYGSNFAASQLSLFRYFAKSFGCRLVDAGRLVPFDVVAVLNQAPFETALRLTCSVNDDVLMLPPEVRNGFIGKGDLFNVLDPKNPIDSEDYFWNEYVDWLTVNYWYGVWPDGRTGSTWIADSQFVYLGSVAPLDEDERWRLQQKVRDAMADSSDA